MEEFKQGMPEEDKIKRIEEMEEAQKVHGVYVPLIKGEDGVWYVKKFGELVEIEQWKREYDDLHKVRDGERRDLN